MLYKSWRISISNDGLLWCLVRWHHLHLYSLWPFVKLQAFHNSSKMHSPPVQDALSEPLVIILAHPNHTVCVTASWTLRCFCYSTPLRLVLMERLQRDLMLTNTPSSTQEASQRALWHTYGLAALVSAIPKRPLYVLTQRFLDTATQQLKRASDHDLKVASIEVEVAWILIVSLMSLGPNFVRPYLLWRNVCACVDAAWLSACAPTLSPLGSNLLTRTRELLSRWR